MSTLNPLNLPIAGMTCASCVTRVERALAAVPGVVSASVNLATEKAQLQLGPVANTQALAAAVERAGYTVPHANVAFDIDGMTCASCVSRVERALRAVPGVIEASVNLATNRATVVHGGVGNAALIAAVQRAGYEARVVAERGATPVQTNADAGWRVALAALLSMPLVLPMLAALFGYHAMLPALWQFALATPVQFWLGARFFRAGWKAVRAGSANMDLLVALGTSAAYGLSLLLWWRAADAVPHLYFESAAVVITLVLLGKWLESRAKRRTLDALSSLRALAPENATVHRDGVETSVPLDQVRVGDEVVVRPGERVPIDGVLVEGRSHFDE